MATRKIQGKRIEWPYKAFLLLFVVLLFGAPRLCPAEENAALAVVGVLPVRIEAGLPQASLADGLRNMLISRLAQQDSLQLLPAAQLQKAVTELGGRSSDNMADLFARSGVEYLLAGRLQTDPAVGWRLEIDLFRSFSPEKSVQTFSVNGAVEQEIMPAIDRLVFELGQYIQSREQVVKEDDASSPAKEDLAFFRTAHPERSNLDILSLAGVFSVENPAMVTAMGFALEAMDVGDVIGDGRDELVLAGGSRLELRRAGEQPPAVLAEIAVPEGLNMHAVSLADLNQDGRCELYVSGQDGARPSSFILEWDGVELVFRQQDLPWYIRALDWPGRGAVLVGQRFSESGDREIFYLRRQDGVWVAGEKVNLLGKSNLFDFVFADLDGDGSHERIMLDQENGLRVYGANGRPLWRSETAFGMSHRAINGPRKKDELIPLFAEVHQQIAIPPRIVVADFDADGADDIVINESRGGFSLVLDGGKKLPDGIVYGLTWDGKKLRRVWRTGKIKGAVVDCQVRSVARKSEAGMSVPLQLYLGVNLEPGLWGGSKATGGRLLTYNLDMGWL